MPETYPLIEGDMGGCPVLVIGDESAHKCVYSGEPVEASANVTLYASMPDIRDVFDDGIPSDESVIENTEPAPFGEQPLKLITTKTSTAGVLSLSRIDDLANTIESLSEADYGTTIAPSGRVMYDVMRGDIPYDCMVCSQRVDSGTPAVAFRSTYQNTGVVHDACTERFVTALHSVWEYSDDVLPATL